MNLYGKDAGSRNAVKPRRGVKKLARPSSTAQDKRSVLHQIGEFMKWYSFDPPFVYIH